MSLGQTIYKTFFQKTSTMMLTVVVGAFIFERTFDVAIEALYDEHNRGKQWKDIKHKYEN